MGERGGIKQLGLKRFIRRYVVIEIFVLMVSLSYSNPECLPFTLTKTLTLDTSLILILNLTQTLTPCLILINSNNDTGRKKDAIRYRIVVSTSLVF